MTREDGATARYPSVKAALGHLGKVRAQAIGSGFMEALISDVLVDFRVHPATKIGDTRMGSIVQRFGDVYGVPLGSGRWLVRMHESGVEPHLRFRVEGPRPRGGARRSQLV
jgi:hypothetical protein